MMVILRRVVFLVFSVSNLKWWEFVSCFSDLFIYLFILPSPPSSLVWTKYEESWNHEGFPLYALWLFEFQWENECNPNGRKHILLISRSKQDFTTHMPFAPHPLHITIYLCENLKAFSEKQIFFSVRGTCLGRSNKRWDNTSWSLQGSFCWWIILAFCWWIILEAFNIFIVQVKNAHY